MSETDPNHTIPTISEDPADHLRIDPLRIDPLSLFVLSKQGRPTDLKVLLLAEAVEDSRGRFRAGPDGGLYRYDHGVY